MSAKTEKLLAQYRVYENLVRTAGFDPKTLEDSMDETKSNEMRMVRMFRNFLSHNQVPGFLEPTDKMLAFLDKEVQEWTMRGDVVKKHLKTPAAAVCEEKETCVAGVAKLAKLKQTKLVVVTKAGKYELCDIFALAAQVATSKASKISAATKLKEKPVFVTPTTLISDVDNTRVNICTSDGTETGKLLGITQTA